MKKDRIKLENYKGTWYIFGQPTFFHGQMAYFVESEQYGDYSQHLLIDRYYNVLCDEFESDDWPC